MHSLFVPVEPANASTTDTEHWLPTELSRGPWSPDSLHGGPPAALLTRALERLPARAAMRLVRVTVELLRPVPLAAHVPLWLTSEVVRNGTRVGIVESALGRADDGKLVALARGQRIRVADVEFADGAVDEVPELPTEQDAAADARPTVGAHDDTAYHSHAVDHRFLRGRLGEPGPAFDWIRLGVPVVPGEEPTGWQRAMAAADFANGISAVAPFDGSSLFINPDLTVTLWREPEGEWVGLDSVTRTAPGGIGISDTALWDRTGRIGRSTQSLLLDRS
jgi:hypothetical protein